MHYCKERCDVNHYKVITIKDNDKFKNSKVELGVITINLYIIYILITLYYVRQNVHRGWSKCLP